MKKGLFINIFFFLTCISYSQEVLRIKSGGSVTIQNGAELVLQGGLTLDNGSNLVNNGNILLKNNTISDISDWTDNSIPGALTGYGIVIFNSTHPQQFTGSTSFYTVYVNTYQLTINNDLSISNLLRLIKGKINTANYVIALVNSAAASLESDLSNANYENSWINGFLRRSITTNTDSYDFPVGNSERSNLLKFLNNNITGLTDLTSSFGPKPGTDAGLNVVENGNTYTAVNNGGVWKLVPNTAATGGNYALHLYFNGFTGLVDNRFAILRRPDASTNAADWTVPAGSLLEPLNGMGRKLSDGFARRYNISDFSQLGIGEFNLATPCEITGQSQVIECVNACTYTQGFYGNSNGNACYNNSGVSMSSSQLMLNAFGGTTSKVFGNVTNRRFFTLYSSDITSGAIYKMLPGGGNAKPINIDNNPPFDGAYYADQSTWSLVPLQPNGPQKGKINNSLLAQTITLWFNLQNSSSLGNIILDEDTLLTKATATCSSATPVGEAMKFGLPHSVLVYLNGNNGYAATVNGLFLLANDVLGGVNTNVTPLAVQQAVNVINNAFDGCRVLVGTIPYDNNQFLTRVTGNIKLKEITETGTLDVMAYPNPYQNHFHLIITSPVSGIANIEFYTLNGQKVHEINKPVTANSNTAIKYNGPLRFASLVYKVTIAKNIATGIVLKPD